MTTVTVLAGERTIGGTLVVVEDGGARLLFDCGMAYDPAGDPFGHADRRPGRELTDLIRVGLVPYLPQFFEARSAETTRFQPALPDSDGPVAVALSHSHLDHSHLTGFVRRDVPLYASEPAARIVDLLGRSGRTLGGTGRSMQSAEEFGVGTIHVRLVPVDHDVGGARGMIVTTTGGVIAYSGDLRLHGAHPGWTLAFARAARDAGARLLILEGTRVFPPVALDPDRPAPVEDRVEEDVAPDVARVLQSIPGKLGVILLTPENGERVEAIAAAARTCGRLTVLDPEAHAFAVAALGRQMEPPVGVFETLDTPDAAVPAGSPALPRVTPEDIALSPGDYLLHIPFAEFATLLDVDGALDGGAIMTANGPPLGPFDPAWRSLEWWAAKLGSRIVDVGCTGHAAVQDLARIAGLSRAPAVMCIHSRAPEYLPIAPERLLLPERGRAYDLAALP